MFQKTLKLAYKLSEPFQEIYGFIFRPQVKVSKCIIGHNGKILMVRLNYRHDLWTLPRGGVKSEAPPVGVGGSLVIRCGSGTPYQKLASVRGEPRHRKPPTLRLYPRTGIWGFPVRGKEDFKDATGREAYEEVGIRLKGAKEIRSFIDEKKYLNIDTHLFYECVGTEHLQIDNFEIKEAGWFPKDKLPRHLSESAETAIKTYLQKASMR